jgi:hypothetical protein
MPQFYYGTPPLHHPFRRTLLHLNTAPYLLPRPLGEGWGEGKWVALTDKH